jgi:multiple sugar transport system permease protein
VNEKVEHSNVTTTSAAQSGSQLDPRLTNTGVGMGRKRRFPWAPVLFLAPASVYIVLFFGYPIVKNVLISFQDYTTKTFYTGEAPWVGWANYTHILRGTLFSTALVNTALFTVVSIIGQFVIGLLLALFFQRKFPLNGVLRSLFLLPWLIPLIASSAVWKWILDQDSGILNQTLLFLHLSSAPIPWLSSPNVALISVILVNIWLGIPFNMTILYSGLEAVPTDQYEAAALDGASSWRSLVLGVVYTLKVLDIILGLTGGGPANATQTIATLSYQASFVQFSFGTGAALSNILIVISLGFALLYLRLNRKAVDE